MKRVDVTRSNRSQSFGYRNKWSFEQIRLKGKAMKGKRESGKEEIRLSIVSNASLPLSNICFFFPDEFMGE